MKPATKRRLKRGFWFGLFGFALIVLLSNRWVVNSTNAYLYTNWALLPENDVGLVMGTSPYRADGKSSAEFYGRMRAAAQLYQLGKVKHLIVSGANPDSTYNEPRQMLRELVRLGVPENDITMDFAGFRTLDSITRADVVFGLKRFTIITTRYHAWRSLFIARKLEVDAVAFAAPIDVTGDLGKRNPWREILARTLAVADVVFLGTQPTVQSDPKAIKLDGDAEKT